MPLSKFIDLVAEVAAKRLSQERESKQEPSDAVAQLLHFLPRFCRHKLATRFALRIRARSTRKNR